MGLVIRFIYIDRQRTRRYSKPTEEDPRQGVPDAVSTTALCAESTARWGEIPYPPPFTTTVLSGSRVGWCGSVPNTGRQPYSTPLHTSLLLY